MTYANDTLKPALDLVFAVSVEGVRYILVEEAIPIALFNDRPQLAVIPPGGLDFGETRIDIRSRQQNGGSFGLTLLDDPTLRAIFSPRKLQNVYLTANIDKTTSMTGSGVITVSSTDPFPASGDVYIGGEAFAYAAKTSTTLTSVNRSVWGTTAQRHNGGAAVNAGAVVTSMPASWSGRRVTVYAGYKVAGEVAEVQAIGTWRLDSPPSFAGSEHRWTLSAGELSDDYRSRQAYEGLTEVAATGVGYLADAADSAGSSQFRLGGITTHVLARVQSGAYFIRSLVSVSGTVLGLGGADLLTPTFGQLGPQTLAGSEAVSAQHVAVMQGDPVDITLKLLLSTEGQGANGVYDVLPGRDRAIYGGGQWRMGAGFLESEVDVGSFKALLGSGAEWSLVLHEPLNVGELLRQLCLAVGAYWHVDTLGRLSLGRIEERASPGQAVSSVLIGEGTELHKSPEALTYDEREILHTVRLRANWSPIEKEYLVSTTVIDWELKARFPGSSRVFDMASKMITLDTYGFGALPGGAQRLAIGGGQPVEAVQVALRRAQNYAARGTAEYAAECAWPASLLSVGQVVRIEHARLPNLEGGPLTAQMALVLAKRINPDEGTVSLRLRLIDRGYIIAPVGMVSSISTVTFTDDTMHLDASDPSVDPSLASPASAFAVGWEVDVYTGTSIVPQIIAAIDEVAHTVRFTNTMTGALYFSPTAGYAFVDAPSGFSETDFIYQTTAAGAIFPTRWS